jgi:hypothetical protein
MPSMPTKASNGSKAVGRPITDRPSADKTAKAGKASVPPKAKGSSSGSNIARPRRWSKDSPVGAESADAAVAEAIGAAVSEERSRSGLTKTELKAQFGKLSSALAQLAALKRSLNKSFVEMGNLLQQIRNERLYEVKGYGSFEAFVERELDLNNAVSLRLVRIAECLHRDQALAAGLERASAAVAALDGEVEGAQLGRPGGSPAGGVPLHKQ